MRSPLAFYTFVAFSAFSIQAQAIKSSSSSSAADVPPLYKALIEKRQVEMEVTTVAAPVETASASSPSALIVTSPKPPSIYDKEYSSIMKSQNKSPAKGFDWGSAFQKLYKDNPIFHSGSSSTSKPGFYDRKNGWDKSDKHAGKDDFMHATARPEEIPWPKPNYIGPDDHTFSDSKDNHHFEDHSADFGKSISMNGVPMSSTGKLDFGQHASGPRPEEYGHGTQSPMNDYHHYEDPTTHKSNVNHSKLKSKSNRKYINLSNSKMNNFIDNDKQNKITSSKAFYDSLIPSQEMKKKQQKNSGLDKFIGNRLKMKSEKLKEKMKKTGKKQDKKHGKTEKTNKKDGEVVKKNKKADTILKKFMGFPYIIKTHNFKSKSHKYHAPQPLNYNAFTKKKTPSYFSRNNKKAEKIPPKLVEFRKTVAEHQNFKHQPEYLTKTGGHTPFGKSKKNTISPTSLIKPKPSVEKVMKDRRDKLMERISRKGKENSKLRKEKLLGSLRKVKDASGGVGSNLQVIDNDPFQYAKLIG